MTLQQTFSALGDPIRFAIVSRLLDEGELSAGDLQTDAKISAPAFSRHLKVLRTAGVIDQRVDAQRRLYTVRKEAVETIYTWTLNYKEFWESSMNRLEAALLKDEG